MNASPLVSVCVPAYNAETTLRATLDSVLRQDYANYKVIVSDNQSNDGTRAIIETFATRGVQYCYHQAGRPEWATAMPGYIGGFANWNFVLSQGQGDFLCLYHADDLFQPDIIRKQVEVMQAHPETGAVFTMFRAIGEDNRPIKRASMRLPRELQGRQVFGFSELFNAILKHGNFLASPSVMLRRTAYQAVGEFDERRFLTSADLEMWLRIARHYQVGVIDEPLLNYRISQKQFGAQYNKSRTTLPDFFMVMDHFMDQPEVRRIVRPDALKFYEMERSVSQVFCAMRFLAQGKIAEARLRLCEALRWQCFATALSRPLRLVRLLAGWALWMSVLCGCGPLAGRSLSRAYQRELQRRQKPAGWQQ